MTPIQMLKGAPRRNFVRETPGGGVTLSQWSLPAAAALENTAPTPPSTSDGDVAEGEDAAEQEQAELDGVRPDDGLDAADVGVEQGEDHEQENGARGWGRRCRSPSSLSPRMSFTGMLAT